MTTTGRDSEERIEARKLLMVSHAFPPIGGSGVQRSVKFAKYLPEFGWSPVVWASDSANGLPIDESLVHDIPAGVRVVREATSPGKHRVGRTLRGEKNARSLGGLGRVAARFATAIDRRLSAYHDANPFPDDCAKWALASVEPALRLIEDELVDAIYSTYSPVSNHTLAMELKHATSLPWVADFRDLWTDDPRYREASETRNQEARDLERQILEAADVVVAVSPRQREILASRVSGCSGKFKTITNGYDPDDFSELRVTDGGSGDRFVLAHVGRLDVARTKPALFEALGVLSERLGKNSRRLVLRVVGHCNTETVGRLESTGVSIETVGYVSHAEAIREMAGADALLALLPTGRNAESIICGKLFEYLATGHPILVVGPAGGECERIVRECDAGIAVDFEVGSIVDSVMQLYGAGGLQSECVGCKSSVLQPYSRVSTTRELAGVLDGLVPAVDTVFGGETGEVVTSR